MENKVAKSSIIMDTLKLCIITLIAGLLLSATYEVTLTPKQEQAFQKKLRAYKTVMTETDSTEIDEELNQLGLETKLEEIDVNYKKISINEVAKSFNLNKEMIGYIVTVTTTDSYKDSLSLTIGCALDGTVTGIEFLTINETAGLGMKAKDPKFKDQFAQKNVAQFALVNTGAKETQDIDALSGATITSKAVVNAVNAGIGFLQEYTEVGGGVNE